MKRNTKQTKKEVIKGQNNNGKIDDDAKPCKDRYCYAAVQEMM